MGWKIEGLNHVGGRAMHAPTTRREIATARCISNAGLHHCNGQMYLQPSVAPPSPAGARIARPLVPEVITAIFRAGARRVIGATAKPLYAIDGKAGGLDRRNPRPPSSREGDRRSGGRSLRTEKGVPTISVDFLFSVRKQLNLVSVFCPTGERRTWASIGYAPRRRGSTGRWANESEHTREE